MKTIITWENGIVTIKSNDTKLTNRLISQLQKHYMNGLFTVKENKNDITIKCSEQLLHSPHTLVIYQKKK